MRKGGEFHNPEFLRGYVPGMWHKRMIESAEGKGWNQADLARASGVPYESLTKYWRGAVENPRGQTLAKIAKALGVSVGWLRGDDPDPRPGNAPRLRLVDGDPPAAFSSTQLACVQVWLSALLEAIAESGTLRGHLADPEWRATWVRILLGILEVDEVRAAVLAGDAAEVTRQVRTLLLVSRPQ